MDRWEAITRGPRADGEMRALDAYLELIASALSVRDGRTVARLVRESRGSHLPREVREELEAVSAFPPGGFRVAIRFLQYRHRMRQLLVGGEPLPKPQLELALGPGAGCDGSVAWQLGIVRGEMGPDTGSRESEGMHG